MDNISRFFRQKLKWASAYKPDWKLKKWFQQEFTEFFCVRKQNTFPAILATSDQARDTLKTKYHTLETWKQTKYWV